MDDEITYIICSIDSLINENRDLRARLEALEQAWSKTSAVSESKSEDNEQTTTDVLALLCNADDNTVAPLTNRCLSDVKRQVGGIKTTWTELRQVYPPGQSEFAPLTDSDDGLEPDHVFSQAATMSAYGMELLRVALSNPKVGARHTRLAYKLFATLCSTLIDTRDQHRSSNKTVGEAHNAIGHARDMDAVTSKLVGHKEQCGRANSSSVNKRKVPDCWDSSGPGSGGLPSWREHPRHSERRERSNQSASTSGVKGTNPVAATSDLRCTDHIGPIGDTSAANVAAEKKPDLVGGHGLVKRRLVIRHSLLRQGLSESDISAYFDQWTKQTNSKNDSQWGIWVRWCANRNVDPLKRSEQDLYDYVTGTTKSYDSRIWMSSMVRSVWSVIEGPVLPTIKKETG